MRVGFYDPYLDTLGGGEKYLLTVLMEALELGCECVVLSPTRPDPDLWTRLNISVRAGAFRWRRALHGSVPRESSDLDLLVTLHNLIPPLSRARRSVAVIQFPFMGLEEVAGVGALPGVRRLVLGRRRRALGSYDDFVCYSHFAQRHLRDRLGAREPIVIAPPVDLPSAGASERGDSILAVGRFFGEGFSKRHDVLIEGFRLLRERLPDGHPATLELAGGSKDDASARRYIERLREQASGMPVHFHVNAASEELERLYRSARLFWHAAGFGVSEGEHPERMEHFGITSVEAMAHGCVPVVIRAGGQPEIVTDGHDGYLWTDMEQLVGRSLELLQDPARCLALSTAAEQRAADFSVARFRERARRQILALS